MLFPFKRKEKFDKYSIRGMVYAGISLLGIGYELFLAREIRVLLIVAYGIIVAIGILYIWYIKPYQQN